MRVLMCLLILQENFFPRLIIIIDTLLLRKIPYETSILRDLYANLLNIRVSSSANDSNE